MSDQGGGAVSQKDIVRMTARVSAAYMGRNPIDSAAVGGVITSIHDTLYGLASQSSVDPAKPKRKPAVAVAKSVAPNYLVCLEDGKRLKMLKRHLKAAFGLTPEEYRQRWNLPPDYPMVAPKYAAQRSAFAKKMGLGKNRPAKT